MARGVLMCSSMNIQAQATDMESWHLALAAVWARYNGMRGTTAQLTRIRRQLGVEDLERMLGERGYMVERITQNAGSFQLAGWHEYR